ncbi:glycosyltransferase family 2 protein [Leisingera sp. XS_AS12]|uniref:glycosyltransferase family 2 protein n=1 Tax=Leisingera sp. XS_AS12 TaxID=3241294 RepID=UPI003516F47B
MTRIDVALCTFRRASVCSTLASLATQRLPEGVQMRIIIADNDETDSARSRIDCASAALQLPLLYLHAPARNISIARNACLEAADADWIAFLDDDEQAEPDWLAQLLDCALSSRADAVFGPALAEYGPQAPDWMRRQDHHSNHPVRQGSRVETGHTCNALLRWKSTPWQTQRFDPARGKSGGEDTEFFFRLHRSGARFDICPQAVVRETVSPERLEMFWLLQRKYRAGQSHAARSQTLPQRAALAASATCKMLFCAAAALVTAWSAYQRNFWLLRAALHTGVASGCLALSQPEIYGRG